MATHATVLTFHVGAEQVPELLELLDGEVGARAREHPDFRGLTCLASSEDHGRSHVVMVSLWERAPDEATTVVDDLGDKASEALGTGVARHVYRVLREFPIPRSITST